MIVPATTGRIYIRLSAKYDGQQNPVYIHPTLSCRFLRYSRSSLKAIQPAVTHDFDVCN